jgi:hypothetical protein
MKDQNSNKLDEDNNEATPDWPLDSKKMSLAFFKDQIKVQDDRYEKYQARAITLIGYLGLISTILATGAVSYLNLINSYNGTVPTEVFIGAIILVGIIVLTLVMLVSVWGLHTFQTVELSKSFQKRVEHENSTIVASTILSTYIDIWEKNENALKTIPKKLKFAIILFVHLIIIVYGLILLIFGVNGWIASVTIIALSSIFIIFEKNKRKFVNQDDKNDS